MRGDLAVGALEALTIGDAVARAESRLDKVMVWSRQLRIARYFRRTDRIALASTLRGLPTGTSSVEP